MSPRGLTLVECLAGALVGSVLLGATCAVLLAGHRAAFALAASLEAREQAEAAQTVLHSELRQMAAGELLWLTDSSVALRALRGTAMVCATDTARSLLVIDDSTFDALRAIDPLRDSLRVVADSDPQRLDDDAWVAAGIASSAPAVCPSGSAGIALTVSLAPAVLGAILPGAAARVVEIVEYRNYLDGTGARMFGTRSPSGGGWSATSPISGPLAPASGLMLADTAGLLEGIIRVLGRGSRRDSALFASGGYPP